MSGSQQPDHAEIRARGVRSLAFLQWVIRSGEPWTETCYAAVTETLGSLDALLDEVDRLTNALEIEATRREALEHVAERAQQRSVGLWDALGPDAQTALIEGGWHP